MSSKNIVIDWKKRGVILEFEGTITLQDIMDVSIIFFNSEEFPKMKFQLWDFLNTQKLELSKSDIKEISNFDHGMYEANEKMKTALLGTHPSLNAIFEEYKSLMSDTSAPIGLFSTKKEALAWCNAKS